MLKKIVLLSLTASAMLFADTAVAETQALNTLSSMLQKPANAPDWLKRTSFGLSLEKDYSPAWSFETVQPLVQPNDDGMAFVQIASQRRNGLNTYNAGIGYRHVVKDIVLLGINSFYDYQAITQHKRYGVGAELFTHKLEARVNRYRKISDTKEVQAGVYETVLNGYDAEIGGVVPMTTNLKAFASYSAWDVKDDKDLRQASLRVVYPLTDNTIFTVAGTHDYNNQVGITQDRLMGSFNIALGSRSNSAKNAWVSEDLRNRLLVPVKRSMDIKVQRKSLGVVIARGN